MGRYRRTAGYAILTGQAGQYRTSWWEEAMALLAKDARAELRTKVAVSAVGVFTLAALLLLTLATATLKGVRTTTLTGSSVPAWDAQGKMGMLWILLCFAAFTGLSHSFVHEEETGTVTALRLSMSAGGVYAGKLIFNAALIGAVAAGVTPLYMGITEMPLGSLGVFISVMASGCLGLAAVATIIAAMAAKAGGSGALFAAIGLPILVVFLMLLLNAAGTVFVVSPPWHRIVRDVGGLLSFGVLIIALSGMTFGFLWEE